jgi:raffinose/stachyose/melibiose transport system permease protein
MSTHAFRAKTSPWKLIAQNWALYLALLPTMALILVFAYYPTVNGIAQSLFSSNANTQNEFVGLGNFETLWKDRTFWRSFGNALWYFSFSISIGWVIPFVVAELMISLSSPRLQYVLRTALILPMAFPAAVFAFIWSFMYDPNSGVINTFFNGVGLPSWALNWLGDPRLALGSLMMIGFPIVLLSAGGGLPFLLILSGLQSIPQEIFDAAAVDGCSRLRRALAIDLPLLGSQFNLLFVLALISLTQAGGITLLLATNGGPAFSTTTPIVWLIQTGISAGDFGYGAAIGTVLFAVSLVLSLGYQGVQKLRSMRERA